VREVRKGGWGGRGVGAGDPRNAHDFGFTPLILASLIGIKKIPPLEN